MSTITVGPRVGVTQARPVEIASSTSREAAYLAAVVIRRRKPNAVTTAAGAAAPTVKSCTLRARAIASGAACT